MSSTTSTTAIKQAGAVFKDDRRKLKKELWKQYNRRCYLCQELLPFKDCTVDHMDPLSRTGEDVPINRACCCVDCNEEKGDLRVDEYTALIALMKELDREYILYNFRDKGFILANGDTYVPELILPAYNLVVDIKSGFDDSCIPMVNTFRKEYPRWHLAVFKQDMTPKEFVNTLVTGGFRNANLYLTP